MTTADPPDVLFALTGDIRENSRALRQVRALNDAGLSVLGLGIADAESDETVAASLRLVHLKRPSGSGPRWFRRVHLLFRDQLRSRSARLYHASDLFVLPALAGRAKRTGGKLTFDSRELYPHVGATAGKPWASFFWRRVEGAFIRRADAVFTVNDSIAGVLRRSYRIERPVVVPNIPLYRPVAAGTYLRDWCGAELNEIVLLLQGHLKNGRGCFPALEAMPHLPGFRLVFLGDGPLRPALEQRADSLDLLDRVHFHDLVPPDALLDVTASADVGLCLIEPLTESLRLSLPNKLFEYLRAGLPVVASDLPEIGGLVRKFAVGAVVPEITPSAVAQAIRSLASSRADLETYASNIPPVFETFDPEAASTRFTNTIAAVLGTS